jgi:hypothetical protein
MKLKFKVIGLSLLTILNMYFWFQPNSDFMLLVHLFITFILGGLFGYVLSDKLDRFFE